MERFLFPILDEKSTYLGDNDHEHGGTSQNSTKEQHAEHAAEPASGVSILLLVNLHVGESVLIC
jgi:hypothetical protein